MIAPHVSPLLPTVQRYILFLYSVICILILATIGCTNTTSFVFYRSTEQCIRHGVWGTDECKAAYQVALNLNTRLSPRFTTIHACAQKYVLCMKITSVSGRVEYQPHPMGFVVPKEQPLGVGKGLLPPMLAWPLYRLSDGTLIFEIEAKQHVYAQQDLHFGGGSNDL